MSYARSSASSPSDSRFTGRGRGMGALRSLEGRQRRVFGVDRSGPPRRAAEGQRWRPWRGRRGGGGVPTVGGRSGPVDTEGARSIILDLTKEPAELTVADHRECPHRRANICRK